MRYKIAVGLILLCVLLAKERTPLQAQVRHNSEHLVDSPFRFSGRMRYIADSNLSVIAPNSIYANRRISKPELSRMLPDYDPERSSVQLYGYYTLRHSNYSTKQLRIRVPFYSFQGRLATYSLDSVLLRGDTSIFRFGIPGRRGHSYEVSLSWKADRIIAMRYVGQGSAGSFTMCIDGVSRPIGMPIALNHVRPSGSCYDMYYEYEGTHFIGRGISPANRKELLVLDEGLRLLRSYQLRYKIASLVSGDAFYVIFNDRRLTAAAAEVPVAEVITSPQYLR